MLGMLRQWPKWLDAQPPRAARPCLLSFVPCNAGIALYSLHRLRHALALLQQTPGGGGNLAPSDRGETGLRRGSASWSQSF